MKRTLAAIAISIFTLGTTAPAFADGATTFAKKCASCHGKDGKGDTKMGQKLGAKDLTDPKIQAAMTDAQIKDTIENGKKNDAGKQVMKGFKGKLSDAEIAELVQHVRSLKAK